MAELKVLFRVKLNSEVWIYLDSLIEGSFRISRSISVSSVVRSNISGLVIELSIDNTVPHGLSDDKLGILRSIKSEMIGNVC